MPTEVYYNGINIIYAYIPLVFMGLLVHYVTIPVLYDLQIISTYDVSGYRTKSFFHYYIVLIISQLYF